MTKTTPMYGRSILFPTILTLKRTIRFVKKVNFFLTTSNPKSWFEKWKISPQAAAARLLMFHLLRGRYAARLPSLPFRNYEWSRILLYPTLGVVPTAFDRRWSERSLEIKNGCRKSIDGWETVRLDCGSGVLSLSFLCLVPHSRGFLSPSYRVIYAPSLRSCT